MITTLQTAACLASSSCSRSRHLYQRSCKTALSQQPTSSVGAGPHQSPHFVCMGTPDITSSPAMHPLSVWMPSKVLHVWYLQYANMWPLHLLEATPVLVLLHAAQSVQTCLDEWCGDVTLLASDLCCTCKPVFACILCQAPAGCWDCVGS